MTRLPTAEDLSMVPTCGEIEFEIPNVTWPDGTAMHIRLRALDARKQADVDRRATQAGAQHKTEYDDMTALVWTVYHGLAYPKLDEEQVGVLWRMNAWILEEIASYLETLRRLPARELQAHLERLAGVPVPEKKESTRKKGSRRTGSGSDNPTGDPAGGPATDGGAGSG